MNFIQELQQEKRFLMEILLETMETKYHIDAVIEKPKDRSPFDMQAVPISQACCLVGHRPEKLEETKERCVMLLMKAILNSYDQGFRVFITGTSRGVELWAAEAVWAIQSLRPDARLVCAIPYEGFENRWYLKDRELCRYLMQKADFVYTASSFYQRRTFAARYAWMIEQSSQVITIYNGMRGGTRGALKYAKNQKKKMINLIDSE